MGKARKQARSWIGWALGVLAVLTLALSTPEHILDLDEAGGPVIEASVHGHSLTVMDHAQPGHSCAAHCAAHVVGDTPAVAVLTPPPVRPLAWSLATNQDSRAGPAFPLERPPRA